MGLAWDVTELAPEPVWEVEEGEGEGAWLEDLDLGRVDRASLSDP